MGSYVLKEVFYTLHTWNKKERKLDSLSINISMRQILCETFVREVEYLMKTYCPNKESDQKIIFEITEHVFAEDMKKVISIMDKFKKLGILKFLPLYK